MHHYKTAWYSIRSPVSTCTFQAVICRGREGSPRASSSLATAVRVCVTTSTSEQHAPAKLTSMDGLTVTASDAPSLECLNEEADIPGYAAHAGHSRYTSVAIKSPDTDVAILACALIEPCYTSLPFLSRRHQDTLAIHRYWSCMLRHTWGTTPARCLGCMQLP